MQLFHDVSSAVQQAYYTEIQHFFQQCYKASAQRPPDAYL